MTESRQVRRATFRRTMKEAKYTKRTRALQKDRSSKMRIHRNRAHRYDEKDYF